MITIICGEDTASSRNYYIEILENAKEKDYLVRNIPAAEITGVISETSHAPTLFGQKEIFATENLSKLVSRKGDRVYKFLEAISKNKQVEIITWEKVSQRELKIATLGKVKEFKPSRNIFQLLDNCYPTNIKSFLSLLEAVSRPQTEIFILVMLQRHLRNLLLVSSGEPPPSLQSWQIGKLRKQSQLWPQQKLSMFYDGLYKIDSSLKTGKNPHGVKKSLDILASYYL